MKEFEKWFEKHKPYEVYSCMDMAEKAWRAALKWVKDNCDLHDRCGGWEGYIVDEELES